MPDVKLQETIDELQGAFGDFKKSNDERLATLEKKGHVDPLLLTRIDKTDTEVDKLQKEVDRIVKELLAKANRPNRGDHQATPEELEHKAAFSRFMRKGDESNLLELQAKALNITTAADGGYAVPTELDRNILSLMQNDSPMRALCSVVTVGSSDYKKLVNLHGTASGWVDEDDARTITGTPTLAPLTAFMGEIYANPAATQQMLDDSFFNAEAWLAGEVATEFAEKEALAFHSGSGTKQPKGITAYTSAATVDGSRAFGTLQHLVAAAEAAVTGDELITLQYSLKAKHRKNANWMMNALTLSAVRKLKDDNGNYLWQPSFQAGTPSTLLGHGVAENEDMADMAADAISVMFGNFKAGYMIVDRMGSRTLRDPYTNKPYVHFYTTKRVGGMVADSQAIKLLKQAAGA